MANTSGFQDERQREAEFYRYYDAVRSLSDAEFPFTNLFNEEEAKRHKPASSNDKALTAFCQLGALRVGARRCLLFMFDQEYAFILAEATRTLSLRDDRSHDVDDSLWLGQTIIPRGLSVCEHTVNIPADNNGSNRYHDNSDQIHIINDLTDDVRFCDRPYVLEAPKARFYAGVPITAPSGLRIGAYCVLDDKPRNGLHNKEVDFMLEMSATIMEHLEMLRARTEFGRGTRMLTGLGTFVKESPIEGPHKRSRQTTIPGLTRASPSGSSASTADHDADDYFGSAGLDGPVGLNRTSSGHSQTKEHHQRALSGTSVDLEDRSGVNTPSKTPRAQVSLMDDGEPDGGVGETLQRAATLLRDSIEADGVLILDASIHSYGGAVTGEQYYSDSEPDTAVSEDGKPARIDCRVLAQSKRISEGKKKAPKISELTLRSLLRHYPQGKVWSFDANGGMSPNDDESDFTSDSTDQEVPRNGRRTFKRTKSRRMREAQEIQRVFPGARTICLVSIWDNVREQFYAGAIVYTFSPIRQFSSELSYMMAFMDVVMAKVSRIEAHLKDQAKSDFISSVSHELRSPLHGILGSIDFLHDQAVLDWSLISQIEKCSSTLMDVIDHLLDFAKLNHFGKQLRRIGRRDGAHDGNGVLTKSSLASGGSNLTEIVSLAKVTEEVADSIFFSHCCRLDGPPTVEFILDISVDPSLQCDLAVGAWKRLCINIIGNALKYTSSGYVMVSLKIDPPGNKRPMAVLTVADSGCGMSKSFMEDRLFKAFSQENELSNGTGLGMSLVKKLLRACGGKIKVQSAKDLGTVMTVTMPLEIVMPEGTEPIHAVPSVLSGLPIGFLDPPRAKAYRPTKGRKLQVATLQGICRRMNTKIVPPEAAAVVLAFETDVQALIHRGQAELCAVPVVVLCDTVMSAARLRTSHIKLSTSRRVEFVARPFGPAQIGSALQKCIAANGRHTPPALASQVTVGQSRRVLRRQLSRRAHTQNVVPQSPSKAGAKLKRSSSAPLLVEDCAQTKRPQHTAFEDTSQAVAAAAEDEDARIGGTQLAHRLVADPRKADFVGELAIPAFAGTEQKLSLLLVDDNPINLRLLTTYAEKYNHPYRGASNGLEAAQTYESAALRSTNLSNSAVPKPDVVFLDIQMPIMDGYESAQRIRAFEKAAGVKPAVIVAVTGLASNQSQQDAYSSGIDMFLTKPVRPRDITRVLESISASKEGPAATGARKV